MSMHVETVPNRNSRPAVLLRESYREGGKVKKRTLANLTDWPAEKVECLRAALRGDAVARAAAVEIVRSRPHGHVAAVLGTALKLGLDTLLATKRSRERDLCLAMVVARVLDPRSKLATASGLGDATRHHTLGELLDVGNATVDELYGALDWLLAAQPRVEKKLAAKHLSDGCLVLYDLSSTWMEGRKCPLARRGYSRDGKKENTQIVFGVLTDREGCPVAVEVFSGNTADPSTVAAQVQKLVFRFHLKRVVIVGDRGMLTDARIREDVATRPGFGWISALRNPAIQDLHRAGAIQLSLFEQSDLAEITHPDFPGERLIVCKNPLLAAERARKRVELLAATQLALETVQAATTRAKRALVGKDKIALRVGAVLGRWKMAKHFSITITEKTVTWTKNEESIEKESALDGIYVVRTSVPASELAAADVVASYKRLAGVERVFRSMKTVDMRVRPVHHRTEAHVRAHVFLCLLAYYVEWHMRRSLRPLLFDDEDPAAGAARRKSIVAPAQRSVGALKKIAAKQGSEGLPAQSLRTLLRDLATLTRNRIRPAGGGPEADLDALPTPIQARAFELMGVSPRM